MKSRGERTTIFLTTEGKRTLKLLALHHSETMSEYIEHIVKEEYSELEELMKKKGIGIQLI